MASSYIPNDIISQVQSLADIKQIVSEYVALKRRGNNWVGLCPFHQEKTPSFTVTEDKQIFYCFGCGAGGDVFKFLMLIEGMTFVEAVRLLAERYGVEIRTEKRDTSRKGEGEAGGKGSSGAGRISKEEILHCLEVADSFFSAKLRSSTEGLEALSYLKNRGIDEDTLTHFNLGWAPDSWDSLLKELKARSISPKVALEAGLVIEREGGGGYYDRFRKRVIFPILDRRGKVVAFGGRVIDTSEPKYINSPETILYQKKAILYGYFLNRSFIRAQGQGLVVEGYMDLISLFGHGVKNVFATLGTALTEQHARLMKGVAKEWILVFDADEAGMKAAIRALPILYSIGIRPRVLSLEAGHDPDSFIRKYGKDGWEKALSSCEQGIDFVIRMALKRHGDDVQGKIDAADEVIDMLKAVTDPVRKSFLTSYASERLGIRETVLMERAIDDKRTIQPFKDVKLQDKLIKINVSTSTYQFMSFLLNYPHRIDDFIDEGLDYWLPEGALRQLWEAMVHFYEIHGELNIEDFIGYISSSERLREMASMLLKNPPQLEDNDETILRLKEKFCAVKKRQALRRYLIEQIKTLKDEDNCDNSETELLKKISELLY